VFPLIELLNNTKEAREQNSKENERENKERKICMSYDH